MHCDLGSMVQEQQCQCLVCTYPQGVSASLHDAKHSHGTHVTYVTKLKEYTVQPVLVLPAGALSFAAVPYMVCFPLGSSRC